MLTPTRRLLVAILIALVAAACTPGASERPGEGVNRPIGDEPLGDHEVTLHMVQPPQLPPALEGAEVTASELRTENLTERHTVQLVDIPTGVTTLDQALPAGAVLRVPAGVQFEVAAAVDVAVMGPDASEGAPGVVQEVISPCAEPCTVEGPALVAPRGWMAGFGVASTWQLLVPSPIGS